jgi:hypothetical protein
MDFYISIRSGTTLYGEIHSASKWEATDPLDQAGHFTFDMPAGDPNAALIQSKREAWCYAVVGGTSTLQSTGIIDNIALSADTTGKPTGSLTISGPNMLGELNYISVGDTLIDASTTGPGTLMALAPAWGLTTNALTGKTITHQYADDTLLSALITLAEIDGGHFYAGTVAFTGLPRFINWVTGVGSYTPGGFAGAATLYAIYGGDPIAIQGVNNRCVITEIKKTSDSTDALIGRYYAFGEGFGDTRVHLSGTTVPGYMGTAYSMGNDGTKGHYLQHDAIYAAYGLEKVVTYPNTATSASLLDRTWEDLSRQIVVQDEYDLKVIGLTNTIRPLSAIHIIAQEWVGGYQTINVDTDLNVLEVTNRIDEQGARTVGIKCSTMDREIMNSAKVMRKVIGNIVDIKNYG